MGTKLTVLVGIDQSAAIRQGIAANSTEKVELDLATLDQGTRDLLADCFRAGNLLAPSGKTRIPAGQALLTVAAPTPECVLTTLAQAEAARAAKAEKDAVELAARVAAAVAEMERAFSEHSIEEAAEKSDLYLRWSPCWLYNSEVREAVEAVRNRPENRAKTAQAQTIYDARKAQAREASAAREAAAEAAKAAAQAQKKQTLAAWVEGHMPADLDRFHDGFMPEAEILENMRDTLLPSTLAGLVEYEMMKASELADESNCTTEDIDFVCEVCEKLTLEQYAQVKKLRTVLAGLGLGDAKIQSQRRVALLCGDEEIAVAYSVRVELARGGVKVSRIYRLAGE